MPDAHGRQGTWHMRDHRSAAAAHGLVQPRLWGACEIPKPVVAILYGAFRITASAGAPISAGQFPSKTPSTLQARLHRPTSIEAQGLLVQASRWASTNHGYMDTLWSGKASARGMVGPAVQPTLLWYLTAALSCEKGMLPEQAFGDAVRSRLPGSVWEPSFCFLGVFHQKPARHRFGRVHCHNPESP